MKKWEDKYYTTEQMNAISATEVPDDLSVINNLREYMAGTRFGPLL